MTDLLILRNRFLFLGRRLFSREGDQTPDEDRLAEKVRSVKEPEKPVDVEFSQFL
jgi:hypothetical protein